jgi:hypothetical protein
MLHDDLAALAHRIETASPSDPDAVHSILRGLAAAFPDEIAAGEVDPGVIVSTDAAFALLRRKVPNWSIALSGRTRLPDGHWTCTLRESTSRDDDELIGVGRAGTPALAMLAALFVVEVRRSKGVR